MLLVRMRVICCKIVVLTVCEDLVTLWEESVECWCLHIVCGCFFNCV